MTPIAQSLSQAPMYQEKFLNDILLEGIGEGKHFDFIGVDRTNDDDGKPTSAYGMPNSNHATPEKMADVTRTSQKHRAIIQAGYYNLTSSSGRRSRAQWSFA